MTDNGLRMSAFGVPPQPVEATLYLKRKDGVSVDEAKISSGI